MLLIPLRKYSPKLDTPYLTVVLVAVNSAVYLYTLLLAGPEQITLRYGFTPAQPELLTWLTHMFIHGSILHLVGNMFFLYHFGMVVEQALGRVLFVLLYLLSGLCAVGVQALVSWGSPVPIIGASGAVAGVIGLYVALFPAAEAVLGLLLGKWYVGSWETDSTGVGGVWLIYQLLLASLAANGLGDATIAYFAHLGGLGAGFALGYALRRVGLGATLERQMYGLAAVEEQGDPDWLHSIKVLGLGVGATLLLLLLGAGYQGWQRRTAFPPAPMGVAITLPTVAISRENKGQVRPLAVWSEVYSQGTPSNSLLSGKEELILAFNADGTRVALADDAGLVRLINVSDGQTIRTVQTPIAGNLQQLQSLRLSPDGRQFALVVREWLTANSFLYLYQVADDTLLEVAGTAKVAIIDLAYRSDSQLLVIVSNKANGLAVQQVIAGRLAPAFPLPDHAQFCGSSANGEWLIICNMSDLQYLQWTQSIEIWHSSGRQQGQPLLINGDLAYVKVSDDGTRVIIQKKDERAQIRTVTTRTQPYDLPPIAIAGDSFRPSESLALALAIAPRGEVELFDTHSGVLIDVLSLRGLFFGPRIIDARFSPDERFIVTRNADRSIYLWGVAH